MKINIHGSKTLERFTKELFLGFDSAEGEDYSFELFQVHASPQSIQEDLSILEKLKNCKLPKLCLIHRPDELLLIPELKNCLNSLPEVRIILLGDLLLKNAFYKSREKFISVIPHFYLNLSVPQKTSLCLGSFTSWGEMRDLKHFENLVQEIKKINAPHNLEFKVGGTLNGKALTSDHLQDKDIKVVQDFFVPHFNVQLYHLNGSKRLGESSGSLHAGVSIPVIFEANGMERIEGIKVIKVEASDDLQSIGFDKAAHEILSLIETREMDKLINQNLKAARLNTSVDFANQVISMVNDN